MRKTLLSTLCRTWMGSSVKLGSVMLLLSLFTVSVNAQISVYVLEPEANAGPLTFTWSETWGADLDSVPPVEGYLEFVNDGTEADSLGCEALVNPDLTGKIAVVYRGICEFGMKALRAQTANASAVIIINNIGGQPVGMGAGAVGDQVTIPVVMISDVDGATIRQWMMNDDVLVRIGSLLGVFPYNLAFDQTQILLPRAAAIPMELATDAADFMLGARIFNYGNASQDNVRLNIVVQRDGATIYDQTSTSFNLPALQDIWVSMPSLSEAPYSGFYEFTYTILSDEPDAFENDNVYTTTMHIGSIFSYADVDPATGIPITDTYYSATSATGWRTCIVFRDPNASRVAATGLHVNLSAAVDSVFDGNFVEIQANLWDENVSSGTQVPMDDFVYDQQSGDHTMTEAERGQTVFIPFLEPFLLENNVNYLFCVVSNDPRTWHGWDTDIDYDQNMTDLNRPVAAYNITGWVIEPTAPSIGIQMVDVDAIGINENDKVDITPFPNPTSDLIRIPLAGQSGAAMLEIFDMSGAKVAERNVNVGGNEQLVVDMNGISNGTYLFNMVFENGKRANFRVVVSR